ncbi:protein TonB [Thalassotalea insulae]|uniref:Protein TonB n=1 Tax=Thalassotalea insulae TaxID=2056778 RepID=A0ABQ6GRL8_9GAMM|nr:energy transducer TonB [Thalassotalea insulae]GLX78269.1 protein TonB [Thalassotalea insulae]
MKKLLSVFSIAGITTFGLFAFMAHLISSDQVGITQGPPPITIDIVQLPEETKAKPFVRKPFQPPEPPPIMELSKVTPELTEVNSEFSYTPDDLKLVNNITDSATMNAQPDQDASPIVRVNPKYPMDALRNGIQGWVKLTFDISEIGQVINVKVVDSEPKRIFDKAAKQALRKWKYRAKSIDGKHVKQQNFTVQLDFNMEQQI